MPWFARNVPPGVFTIRGFMGVCHLLVDELGDAVLLDTGLIGERTQIRWMLRRLGLEPESIKAILLTHGHLDHGANADWAKRFSGAPLYAHPAEQAHLDGTYPFTGPARWCGRLERAGYAAFNYRPAQIDRFIADGDELPFWGACASCICPDTRKGTAASTARDTICFSAAICSRAIFSTSTFRHVS